MSPQTSCPCTQGPDRYISFKGIDCDGNARRMMEMLDRLQTDDADERTLIRLLQERRVTTRGVQCDNLLLLASFVNPIRELFENHRDDAALALLEQLEAECF